MLPLVVSALAQTVRVEVVTQGVPTDVTLAVRTTWLGEERETKLSDDGHEAGDRAADGVRVANWSGEAVRVLPVTLVAIDAEGERTTLAGYNEAVSDGEDRLVYAVAWDKPPRVRRVAVALASRPMEVADTASVAASLGWVGLVFAWVAWLARSGPEAP